jgi:nucleoside-diphosphate-sugar epimerase
MLAVAAGQPYHIPFGGRCVYQYVDDTARVFIQAARAGYAEAGVFNLPGSLVRMPDIIAAIEAAAPAARGHITLDDKPIPFPEDIDGRALVNAIGALPYTPLDVGVAQTIEIFKSALAAGRISAEVK